MRKRIDDILGTPESEEPAKVYDIIKAFKDEDPYSCENETDLLKNDYQFIRKTFKKAINVNQTVLEVLCEELQSDPTPRMTEIIARLLETLGNNSTQLLGAYKTIVEIFKLNDDKNKLTSPTFQNAIFVGNMSELLKLKDLNKQLNTTGEEIKSITD